MFFVRYTPSNFMHFFAIWSFVFVRLLPPLYTASIAVAILDGVLVVIGSVECVHHLRCVST